MGIVLHCEEHEIAIRSGLPTVENVRWLVYDFTRLHLECLLADLGQEYALYDEGPLFVRMGMRLGRLTGAVYTRVRPKQTIIRAPLTTRPMAEV